MSVLPHRPSPHGHGHLVHHVANILLIAARATCCPTADPAASLFGSPTVMAAGQSVVGKLSPLSPVGSISGVDRNVSIQIEGR